MFSTHDNSNKLLASKVNENTDISKCDAKMFLVWNLGLQM